MTRNTNSAKRRVAALLAALVLVVLGGCVPPSGGDPTGGDTAGDDSSDDAPGDDAEQQDLPDPYAPTEWGVEQGLVTGRYYQQMVADPESYFGDWHDMNLPWIRIGFEEFLNVYYGGYDDPTVQANVEMFGAVIDEAHERGIKVLGALGVNSMPGWIYVDRDAEVPTVLGDGIERFIEATRRHLEWYDVDAIEIWNEPRHFSFTDYDIDGDGENELAGLPAYAELLIETYTTLKPEYPDVIFVAPATSNAFRDTYVGNPGEEQYSIFNSGVMRAYRDANDGALPLDVFSWHPYGRTVDTDGGPFGSFYYNQTFADYHENVLSFTDLDGRPIVGNYPIWFTEYGFETNQTGGLADQHEGEIVGRRYYEQMLDAMAAYPAIEVAFLYTYLDDDPHAAGTQNFTYGIRRDFDHETAPKEMYYAFVASNSGVGVLRDGEIDDVLVRGYLDAGGRDALGTPTSGVYEADGLIKQNFRLNGEQKVLVREGDIVRVE